MSDLQEERIQRTLARLHQGADRDMPNILKGLVRSLGRSREPKDFRHAYIAVSRSQGRLLYSLVRGSGAKNIVEFGTSFGISAVYLGAAARANGGRVVTTEIEANKCEVARANLRDAGLEDVVTLLEGDALQTLRDHEGPIDFLFLDGWNNLYFPLLDLLGPRLRAGATILIDNASFPGVQPFLRYLRESPAFVSTEIKTSDKGAMELVCFTGPWKKRA